MSIICNETRGKFQPISELANSTTGAPPGIAYWFNKIPGLKQSYNTLSGNRTALACFRDPNFVAAHGHRPLGATLANTADARWGGEVYPGGIPVDNKPAITGFVLQADFAKFRGRGFIQTTGRANYKALVRYVQTYNLHNATIDMFKSRWAGMTPDRVCDITTNEDWDMLFQQSLLEIPCEGIRLHDATRGYLNLGTTAAQLTAPKETKGSIRYMGWRISGGGAYAETFFQRVDAVLSALAR